MGKPTGADLTLGLATAPVLFASHQYPRLNSLIMRRFDQPGDVEEALTLVKQVTVATSECLQCEILCSYTLSVERSVIWT